MFNHVFGLKTWVEKAKVGLGFWIINLLVDISGVWENQVQINGEEEECDEYQVSSEFISTSAYNMGYFFLLVQRSCII